MDILSELKPKISFETHKKSLSKSFQRTIDVTTRNFENFCDRECAGRTIEETFDYLLKLPHEEYELKLYHLFQTWINELVKTLDPTTIRNYFMSIKKLARHHGIKISQDDVRENLIFPKKIKERKYVLTLDDIHLILKESSWKIKGFYLFLLSSGMRPQEALSIRKRHIELLANGRYIIHIPGNAVKTKVERESFVSREVFPYLSKILRDKKPNDLVWTGQENGYHAVTTAGATFRNCCDRIGLTQKYESVDRRKLNLYCFRGFFYAKASMKHGDEYAHKMIGHAGYLPQYDRKTIDERLTMYLDYENELITDQTQKLKVENDRLKVKQNEINKMDKKINTVYDVLNKLITSDEIPIEDLIDTDEFRKMVKTMKD